MPLNEIVAARHSTVRRKVLLGMAAIALTWTHGAALAVTREPLKVVATFSILGDMVREIGGERVAVTTIVGPNSDAHHFEPTPQDAKALQEAAVLVLNGLDFEAWLPRLVEASGFKGRQILASKGVKVRRLADAEGHGEGGHDDHDHAKAHNDDHDDHKGDNGHRHGESDPHAWQSLVNGMIYARNIAHGLSRADPRNATYYEGRVSSYIARMKTLDTEVRTALAAIPPERRRVITSHDAFGYFGDAYGIEFIPVAGLSNQAEPSARDVARIIKLAREKKVGGVFVENMAGPKLAQQIARESGAVMGGTLYADALSPSDQPAATYLGMFSWNAGRLVYVLKRATQ
ncbi:MAG TPA: zinc ABC transporter substrate-binding protein [Burkholderiaceae bacterium]|jgi:zinc/manganese transport system substrate-binding protein|nr:zinc ABC transporter substrate-binding protein [Burkholderiaceae bacterium]